YVAGPSFTEWDPGAGWLPVGDAALAFDPISSDGLCFALRSALEAAPVVESALAGSTDALVAYRRGLRDVYDQHIERRTALYGSEQRWPNSPFWSARAGSA
ncbi:MAG TPA: hypothetical protein VF103_01555, partial [Polyangiaceae bacterium]